MSIQTISKALFSGSFVMFMVAGCGSATPSTPPTNQAGPVPTSTVPPAASRPTGQPAASSPTIASPVATAGQVGWSNYERRGEGFAISIPSSWKVIEMDPQVFEAGLKALDPQAVTKLRSIRSQLSAAIKFQAVNLSSEAGVAFNRNVNVVREDIPNNMSLAAYIQANLNLLSGIPTVVKPVAQQHVRLPCGESERLQYNMNLALPNGQQMTVTSMQYLLVDGKNAFVISIATLPNDAEKDAPLAEKIAQDFRLLK